MTQGKLGLFDTPPSRKQIRYSMAIVGLLLLVLVLVLTVPDVPLGEINAFIPMIGVTTTLVDLIIATLLYVQASVFRSRALGALATGYVFTGLILIPHLLTFPGAFTPHGLLGAGVSTTAWIYIFWRTGLPIAVIVYVLFNRKDAAAPPNTERPASGTGLAVFAAVALVVAITILTTVGHDLLPQLYVSRAVSNYPNMLRANGAVIALAAVSTVYLFRQRKSALDVWLLVVMAAWLVQTLLFLSFKGRFSASDKSLHKKDFVKAAQADGFAWAARLDRREDLDRIVRDFIEFEGPAFLEAVIDPDAGVYPMVGPGMGYAEMITGEHIASRATAASEVEVGPAEMF